MDILAKAYEPTQVERKWYDLWEKNRYFHAAYDPQKESFTIVLPPPNVTGSLHMGHAMYVVQDALIRFHRMEGKNTLWLPGMDHAGIATQLVVERTLLKEEGKNRHDLGRDEFIRRIWTWKEKYGNRIMEQMRVLGFSLDWERTCFTLDEKRSQAVQEAFVRLYQDGFIYRAKRLINWCSRCATALSDLEVETEEVDGKIWHIAYPVEGQDERLVVATTRPETLFGDTAVAVHPEDPRFRHLIGKKVHLPLTNRTIPIIGDDILVAMEFGSGVVKVTPAHDFRDFETGQRHQLEFISVFDIKGNLNRQVPEAFIGMSIVDARSATLSALEEKGLLLEEKAHRISLGHCSRCDTIVEPMLSTQWFVKTEPLAKVAIEKVEQGQTKFVPAVWAEEYFRWMKNIRDWCISRQLWWGHQIPAWYDPADDSKVYVARSKEEAFAQAGRNDLVQDEDVLDTWFSSALWPFSTLGWPSETQGFYPTTVMETGHDILFFWVARMMMMGLYFTKEVPFRTVLLHALVVDENGEKMSKVKGNVLDPLHLVQGASLDKILGFDSAHVPEKKQKEEALAKFKKAFPSAAAAYPEGFPPQGADALRFFLLVMSAQERQIRLSIPRIDGYRHFLNKIWSAARFFHMNQEGLDIEAYHDQVKTNPASLPFAERWILSRLQKTINQVRGFFQDYRLSEAAQLLYRFFWEEVCDWYIELAKLSFQEDTLRRQAQGTLAYVLEQSMRLLHPLIPFITEEIWTKLPKPKNVPESLMITAYPQASEGSQNTFMDDLVEKKMEILQRAISAVRSLKTSYRLPNQIQVLVKSSDALTIETLTTYQFALASITKVVFGGVVTDYQGIGALAYVTEGQVVLLPDAATWIDKTAEQNRLMKDQVKREQEQKSLKARLSNPDFLARAKAEVVVETQARILEVDRQLQETKLQIEALQRI